MASCKQTIFSIFLLFLALPVVALVKVDALAEQIYQAHESNEPLPTLSEQNKLDMSTAYAIQHAYVRARLNKSKIAGFKAGLTSDDAQAEFKINRPIFGVLFSDGQKPNQTSFSLANAKGLMIEAELGFIIKERITKKVNSVNELKNLVDKIIPVIELPNVVFDSNPIDGMDLVSVNTGSAYFIPDLNKDWTGYDINAISATVSHDNKIIIQGQGKDALGDQWEALRWLVNQILSHNWVIEKNNILITGALGGMTMAEPGQYKVRYNKGTVLEFTVTE